MRYFPYNQWEIYHVITNHKNSAVLRLMITSKLSREKRENLNFILNNMHLKKGQNKDIVSRIA